MNTKFVYTFKTRRLLFNHLRGLAQLATGVAHSKLPLSDFEILMPYVCTILPFLRSGNCKVLYFTIREHGFEFDSNFDFFQTTLQFRDVIQALALTYTNGYYELRVLPN